MSIYVFVAAIVKIMKPLNNNGRIDMDSRELKTRLLELQYAYGDCKIDTVKFISGLEDLGITHPGEVAAHLSHVEEMRYEAKNDESKTITIN
tara:strand:- start:43 stop:318 length:276 start_codon:yes stop_codon:yes gene_type:complete